jgi:hypothetical protein
MRYMLITGLLTAVYAALVVVSIQVLRFQNPPGVVAGTVVAAMLFNLPRRRLQRAVRRRYHHPA